MSGTVAAKITALTTLQAQANTSAQKRTRFDFQSCLMYAQRFLAPTKIKSIIVSSVRKVLGWQDSYPCSRT
jgi:hypothetical protein